MGKERLAAAAALYAFSSLSHNLAGVVALFHKVVGKHNGEERFLVGIVGGSHKHCVLRRGGLDVESHILHNLRYAEAGENHQLHTIHLASILKQLASHCSHTLFHKVVYLATQVLVLGHSFLHSALHIAACSQYGCKLLHAVVHIVECLLHSLAGDSLDSADAGCN